MPKLKYRDQYIKSIKNITLYVQGNISVLGIDSKPEVYTTIEKVLIDTINQYHNSWYMSTFVPKVALKKNTFEKMKINIENIKNDMRSALRKRTDLDFVEIIKFATAIIDFLNDFLKFIQQEDNKKHTFSVSGVRSLLKLFKIKFKQDKIDIFVMAEKELQKAKGFLEVQIKSLKEKYVKTAYNKPNELLIKADDKNHVTLERDTFPDENNIGSHDSTFDISDDVFKIAEEIFDAAEENSLIKQDNPKSIIAEDEALAFKVLKAFKEENQKKVLLSERDGKKLQTISEKTDAPSNISDINNEDVDFALTFLKDLREPQDGSGILDEPLELVESNIIDNVDNKNIAATKVPLQTHIPDEETSEISAKGTFCSDIDDEQNNIGMPNMEKNFNHFRIFNQTYVLIKPSPQKSTLLGFILLATAMGASIGAMTADHHFRYLRIHNSLFHSSVLNWGFIGMDVGIGILVLTFFLKTLQNALNYESVGSSLSTEIKSPSKGTA